MSAESAESPKVASERPGMAPPPPPTDLVEDEAAIAHRKVISDALETIRPNLKRDGGDCELIAVQGDKVWVKMVGACNGCQLSAMTLNGVQAKLVEATGRMIRLFPVQTPGPSHAAPVPLRI